MSILQMSISAGLLVIAIVLIRSVGLNRLPKKMFLVLWGVALFRLLVPVSIPLPFSVPNIVSEITKTVFPDTAVPSVIEVPPMIGNPINVGDTETGITEMSGAMGQATEAVQGSSP
jgi:hypothetical protein